MNEENSLSVAGSALAKLDEFIESIHDAPSADDALWQSDLMEDLLKKADACGEYASAFCLREAQILVKAASLPDHLEVTRRKDMIAWLRTKSQNEIDDLLRECADGVRLHVLKGRETRKLNESVMRERQIAEFNRINEKQMRTLDDTGKVEISVESYYDEWRLKDPPDKQTLQAYCLKSRNDALRHGGVGLGDNAGTYMNPVRCDRNETMQFVSNRLRSIHNDLKSLLNHCRMSKFAVAPSATGMIRGVLDELEHPND